MLFNYKKVLNIDKYYRVDESQNKLCEKVMCKRSYIK